MEPIVENTPNIETVRWAYRFILGREPENEAILAHWASFADGRVILAFFAQSPEAIAHRAAGCPAYGGWIAQKLSPAAIRAAFHLRFNAIPSTEEIAVEIAAHRSLAEFRRALLASPELHAAAGAKLPEAPPEADQTVVSAPASVGEHRFTVLGKSFTLRGDPQEEYWRGLVAGAPDPSPERMARLLNAAFRDGGAGRVLVDAGANIGLTSIAMAIGAPYHADLLCFEPDQRSQALLRENLAAHELNRARVLPEALAERDGTGRLRCHAENTATSVLMEPHSRAPSTGVSFREIQVRRLDTVLAEQELSRLDFLKIDVEGGETSVMLGATEAIARDKPFIFAEFNLWTQMTIGARNPMEVLEEWRSAFRHMVAFDAKGQPVPILDQDGLLWVLHTIMTERGCVDDLVLCDRLDWLERWN